MAELRLTPGDYKKLEVESVRKRWGTLASQTLPNVSNRFLVTEQTVAAAHQLGLEIHVWTINDPQEISSLLDLGVDGVMSDFPGRLLEVVKKRG